MNFSHVIIKKVAVHTALDPVADLVELVRVESSEGGEPFLIWNDFRAVKLVSNLLHSVWAPQVATTADAVLYFLLMYNW